MAMVTVGDGLGPHRALLDDIQVNLVRGSEFLQYGIETLPRPPAQLAKPMDGDAVVVVADARRGCLELPPQGWRLSEPRALLLVVEPCAQGRTYSGVARRGEPSRGYTPVEIAIEALEEVVG